MAEIRKDYYPEEIAMALCELADQEFNSLDEYGEIDGKCVEVRDALYHLMAVAENPYNKDHFRTLWDVLQDITNRWNNSEI